MIIDKLIYAGTVFLGFTAIMNPISAISIFLAMTAKEDENSVKKIALHSTLTAFLIVVAFAIAGNAFLNFFGLTFTALRLAGGIIVGIVGYEMLNGRTTGSSKPADESLEGENEEGSVAITPLGIPLLAGPAVIITAMNFSAGNLSNIFVTISAFLILCIITYYVFIFGKQIKKALGANFLKVVTKMMGLILAVIGMQMILDGIYSAVKDFQTMSLF